MKKKIKVSISGMGVGEQHANFINKNNSTIFSSFFEIDILKKKKIEKKYSVVGANSFESMIEDNETKIVIVASPDHTHAHQIIESFKKKKHVFTEKPICNNLNELKKINYQWKKNKKKLKFRSNLILRSSPLFLWLKNKIESGYFGKIYSIDAEYLYGRLNKFINGWRGKSKDYSSMNGGGVHMIDLACWLVNDLPDEVFSTSNNLATKKYKLNSNDYMASILNFKSGLILRVVANLACVYKHQHILKIYGTKKTFIYDDLGPRIYRTRHPKKTFKKIFLKNLPSNKTNILKGFIEDIKFNKNITKETEFDFRIMNVLCYCNLSAKTSKKIKIQYIL